MKLQCRWVQVHVLFIITIKSIFRRCFHGGSGAYSGKTGFENTIQLLCSNLIRRLCRQVRNHWKSGLIIWSWETNSQTASCSKIMEKQKLDFLEIITDLCDGEWLCAVSWWIWLLSSPGRLWALCICETPERKASFVRHQFKSHSLK